MGNDEYTTIKLPKEFTSLIKVYKKFNNVYEDSLQTKTNAEQKTKNNYIYEFRSQRLLRADDEIYFRKMDTTKFENFLSEAWEKLARLEDDWDGMGSKSYTQKVFARTHDFLVRLVQSMHSIYKIELPWPIIGPGIDGEIDVEWKNKYFEGLLSIPPDFNEEAGFAGSDPNNENKLIKDFMTDEIDGELLNWLKRMLKKA